MQFSLPTNVQTALNTLTTHGYEAYVVGGCVRDLLMGISPHDYDICTSALPDETKACFGDYRVIETGIQHGTVTVLIDHEPFEITTYRTEGDYLDGRHPSFVAFTRNLENDLQRRDFTVNAMAYHPQRGLVDLYGGQKDIAGKCIRCVGDAHTRLTEDALRILRAMRFSAQLGFEVEEVTARAMLDLKNRLHLISRERIASELVRMIASSGAPGVLKRFASILFTALPQCTLLDLHALAALPAGDAVLRTAALLHSNGAEIVEATLLSLKLPTLFVHDCTQLVAHYEEEISPQDVPLWLAAFGQTQFERLALLKNMEERDVLINEMQRTLDEKLPLTLKELAITGRDLIAAGFPAGPRIGEALNTLHEKVLKREITNDQETLLKSLSSSF